MQYITPRTAAESQISITTVVTLFAAVNTAGSTSDSETYYMSKAANAVQITVESGSVRWLEGIDPTATVGNLISGGTVTISGINLSDLRVVSTSGTAVLTVQFIRTNDIIAIVGGGGSSSGGTSSSPAVAGLVYNTVAPSLTNGQTAPLQGDSSGNQLSNLATKIAGENLTTDSLKTSEVGSVTRITTATTTVVKSGFTNLLGIRVEVVTTGIVTIYNNTAASGTTPYILPLGLTVGWHPLPAELSTGCTVVTAAADRICVVTQ